MSELTDDFRKHLELNFPELNKGKVLLAISGGVDSTSLCRLLLNCDVDVSLAHCNFRLRGNDSDLDEQLITRMAEELGFQLHVKGFDTLEYAAENKLSIQMAARELRYSWFNGLLDKYNYSYLVTAHHAGDNIETFLINLSRGSGIEGLTGIPERNGRIIRPLLPFSRHEIEAFAHASNLEWREDQSNADSNYLRNRIRNELMPVMEQVLPSLSKNFRNSLTHLKEARQVLDESIEETLVDILEVGPEITKIKIDKIRSLPNSRFYLFYLLRNYGFNQWDDIDSLLEAQSGKMVFSVSHRLLKDREMLWLQKLEDLPSKKASYCISEGDKSVQLNGVNLFFKYTVFEKEFDSIPPSGNSKNVAQFDRDTLSFPLIVRKWQKGDYFIPKGMTGRKKLSKYFKDEKLSIAEKENIWLLCSGKEIVWIIGYRSDERFKITNKTKRVLRTETIETK